jgi:hypothetical protein
LPATSPFFRRNAARKEVAAKAWPGQGCAVMQTIMRNTRGLSLLVNLNWDRILYVATIIGALWAGAWVGSMQP